MEIKAVNITEPTEKMKKMYDAVSELIRQQKDVASITVKEITDTAGIGKGTAYEYFSSKEEIIASALMYEYSNKIQNLAEVIFQPEDFKERCYKIMDWIKENKEYNQMFSNLMSVTFSRDMGKIETNCFHEGVFYQEARKYINEKIDIFMEYGFEKGIFTESDKNKRSLALLTTMVEYSFVVMGPKNSRYITISEEEIREFIYNSLIKSLS